MLVFFWGGEEAVEVPTVGSCIPHPSAFFPSLPRTVIIVGGLSHMGAGNYEVQDIVS